MTTFSEYDYAGDSYDNSADSYDGNGITPQYLIQSASVSNTGSISASISTASVTTQGNLLALAVFTGNGTYVAQVTDNHGYQNLWTRASSALASGTAGCELWYASGIVGGAETITVTLNATSATDFTLVLMEFQGISSVNAMDQEIPNAGVSNTPIAGAALSAFESDQLYLAIAKSTAALTNPPLGFTVVPCGSTGDSVTYQFPQGTTAATPSWLTSGSPVWLTLAVSFIGPTENAPIINTSPYNFPQIQVEWSPTAAPFTPVWRNVAKYVRSFKTTQGRQHQLDRIEAGSLDITFDNRDGTFNPWNTDSVLFNNYQGLQPMNVIKITASWQGIAYYVAYQYVQSITPSLKDALNIDCTVKCWDILQFLSLRYLSGDNYAQLIEGDTTLRAYWRCGDAIGSFNKQSSTVVHQLYDSTPSTNSGYGPHPATLINGVNGYPLLGVQNVLLYDASTAVDLTNNKQSPSGGFSAGSPLLTATNWSFECWLQYTGGTTWVPSAAASVGNQTIYTTTTSGGELDIRLGYHTSGSGISLSTTSNCVVVNFAGAYQAHTVSTTLFDGNAHYFCVTNTDVPGTGTDTLQVYVDGKQVAQAGGNFGVTGSGFVHPTGTVVGCNSGAVNAFPGIVSEVALYNTTLALSEIIKHHNQGTWLALSGESGGGTGGEGPSAVGRLNKVLAVAGFPNTQFSIGTSYLTPIYGETSPVTTTTALNMIQIIMETEPGIIFQAQDGNIYALNRQYAIGHGGAFGLMNSARASTSQGIFGDTSGSTYRYEYNGFDVGQDDLDIWNDVQAKSGRPQLPVPVLQEVNEETDTTGISKISGDTYGVRTLQGLTNLLFESDMDALAVAQQYFRWYATGKQRAPSVIIQNTFNQGANNIQMLARTLYDRITVNYQGQTAGSLFTQDGLIESINHDVNVDSGTWKTTFALSPYEISLTQISPGGTGNPPSGQLYSVPSKPIVLGTWTFGDNTKFLLL